MKVKKMLVLLFAVMLTMGAVAGCMPKIEFSAGDYKYTRAEGTDGKKLVSIIDLTSKGAKKKMLVIPRTIGGREVSSLSGVIWVFPNGWQDSRAQWRSDAKVEKIFFQKGIRVSESTFRSCKELKKVIIVDYGPFGGASNSILNSTQGDNARQYYLLKEIYDQRSNKNDIIRPANTTYFYNYETDVNYGAYWVDDIEFGEKIEYVPTEPERDDYKFEGWYLEPDCKNEWDFDSHIMLGEELNLYAKWTEK